jgi:hypothetical protein
MNKLRIMLNNRKRFVLSAALAALLVLMVGVANALANTVWKVSASSSVADCSAGPTPVTTCSTIQSAVNAASRGDVILVGPGVYNETVGIGKANLSLLGAQAGRDARVDRHDPTKESIVDASGSAPGLGGGAAFFVNSNYIVIDGFTIRGGANGATTNASGIYVTPFYGNVSQIINNIIQDNAMGLYFGTFGSPPSFLNSYFVLVKHNLFKTNNAGASGSGTGPLHGMTGFGIVGNTPGDGTNITENEFIGNKASAMALAGSPNYNINCYNVDISGNTSYEDGSFLVIGYCYNVIFSHNQGKKFGARGLLPVIPSHLANAAIDAIIWNQALQINDNDLEDGNVPGYSGIDFLGGGPTSRANTVS